MRPACRDCWDPVDRDGAELCDYCAATPAERERRYRRSLAAAVVMVVALFAIVGWLGLA